MGCDIHAVFQRRNKESNVWEDIQSNYRENRHYQLFAVLADVRNGSGFAGVQTGNKVTPIAMPRGLPADFDVQDDDGAVVHLRHKSTYPSDTDFSWYTETIPDHYLDWMGDHSFSWITADEILDYRWPQVRQYGVISRAQYETWDHNSKPDTHYVGVWPSVTINDTPDEFVKHPDYTHVRVSWVSDLSEGCKYFIDEIRRLKELHGEVRMVFGFDS